MRVELHGSPFRPWRELERYEGEVLGRAGAYGASCVFVGTMRDFNEGSEVSVLTLEHYPEMTERHLRVISEEAARRWELLDTLVLHRYGTLAPGDPIVLVAAWSAHRAAAFEAARYLIEELKARAPFWKKEVAGDGERWVGRNTPG